LVWVTVRTSLETTGLQYDKISAKKYFEIRQHVSSLMLMKINRKSFAHSANWKHFLQSNLKISV